MNFLIVPICILAFVVVDTVAQKPFTGACCEEYCYDLDGEKPQSRHFGTKTAYQIIKGSDSNRQYVVPNCNPVKFWFLSRHGTRLPDADEIKKLRELSDLRDEIVDNYEKRHSKPDVGGLCEEDLELLQHWSWTPNITSAYASFLTTQGWDDLKFLALFYQRVFPNVLENIYSPEKFLFKHTNKQRTEASFKAFVEGLFGDHAYDHITLPPMPEKDMLLRPYKLCDAWKVNSKAIENDENSELAKFKKSQIYQQTIRDISFRLGFKFPLKSKQIDLIWDMCRYDLSWQLDRPSAWCASFTQTQVNVLEYAVDLKNYYEDGYGHDLNSRIACATVNDMLNHMESKSLPQVTAYFAHSSTIHLLLTALGAAKDRDALVADNYPQMTRRKFRSSEISPFASNLAVIKYDCPNDNERNKIMFFLNQKPLDFDWCNVGLCNWSDVKRMYSRFQSGNCDQMYCDASSASLVHISFGAVLISTLVKLLT